MICRELLQRFTEALERGEIDWEVLGELRAACDPSFALEAWKAFAKKLTYYAMSEAWSRYEYAVLAGENPAVAYGLAVQMIWELWNLPGIPCVGLTHIAAYVAEAAAEYRWPAKWPFLAMYVAAVKVRGCELPDAVAEALGPDEWARLESFLEDRRGVVEVEGRKAVVIWGEPHFFIAIPLERA